MLFHNTFLKKKFEKIGQVEQKRRNIGLKKLYTADELYIVFWKLRPSEKSSKKLSYDPSVDPSAAS